MESTKKFPIINYESWDEYYGLLETLVDSYSLMLIENFDSIPSKEYIKDIGDCADTIKKCKKEGTQLITDIALKGNKEYSSFCILINSQMLQIAITTTRITICTMRMCAAQPMLFASLKQRININVERELKNYLLKDSHSNPFMCKFENTNFCWNKRKEKVPLTKVQEIGMVMGMALHKRLGEDSLMATCSEEILRFILEWY